MVDKTDSDNANNKKRYFWYSAEYARSKKISHPYINRPYKEEPLEKGFSQIKTGSRIEPNIFDKHYNLQEVFTDKSPIINNNLRINTERGYLIGLGDDGVPFPFTESTDNDKPTIKNKDVKLVAEAKGNNILVYADGLISNLGLDFCKGNKIQQNASAIIHKMSMENKMLLYTETTDKGLKNKNNNKFT